MAGEAGTGTLDAPAPKVQSAYGAEVPVGGSGTIAPSAPAPSPAAPALPPARGSETPFDRLSPHAQPGGPSHPLRTALILTVVLACVAAIVWYGYHASKMAGAKQSGMRAMFANLSTPVVTATAKRGDLPVFVEGLGAVTPFNVVTVKSLVTGAIMSLPFKEGQLVKKGDPIAEIDPRPYQVQLETAQGNLAKDKAALQSANWNVQSDRSAGNAISQQQLNNDTSTALQAQAAVQIDQASIDSANLELTYCHITAPITGLVGLQQVNLGNIVQTSDSTGIVIITELHPIAVEFSIAEDYIPQIMGNRSDVPPLLVEAWDRDDTHKLASGKLLAIDSQIDSTTGTVRLKATFDNPDNVLFPSQFVNAHLLIHTEQNAIVVPTSAIQRGPDSTFVYVVKPGTGKPPAGATGGHHRGGADAAATGGENTSRPEKEETSNTPAQSQGQSAPGGTPGSGHGHGGPPSKPFHVEVVNVTVGPTQGDESVIATGVNVGDVLVTDGTDKLQDQSSVTPHEGTGGLGSVNTTQPSAAGMGTTGSHHGGHRHVATTAPAAAE